MKKANEQLFEYYEKEVGNSVSRFQKACKKFIENHSIKPPYKDYWSFKSALDKYVKNSKGYSWER